MRPADVFASSPQQPASPRQLFRMVHQPLIARLCGWFADDGLVAQRLWKVLLHVSSSHGSVARSIRLLPNLPSATSVRQGLARLLGRHRLRDWEARLNRGLREGVLPQVRGQEVLVVGDEVHLPYWGEVKGRLARETRPGPMKNGTTTFFSYVTLTLLVADQRFVVGITAWRRGEPLAAALERIGKPLLKMGLDIKAWLWDRGAGNVALLQWLQEHSQTFVVAAARRGDKQGTKAILEHLEAAHGWQPRKPAQQVLSYTMSPAKDSDQEPITVVLLISWESVRQRPGQRRQRGARRSRIQPGQRWRAMAWFAGGTTPTPAAAKRLYQRRQSIESSYRMSHGCRGRTSSQNATLRLLLFALSQLLQNEAAIPANGADQEAGWFVDFCHWFARTLEAVRARPIRWSAGLRQMGVSGSGVC